MYLAFNCKILLILVLFLSSISIDFTEAKIYDPCELANELIAKHKFLRSDIADWICLIRWESNFNTSAVGSLNFDGSKDHGLFQISDKYWCENGRADGACGLNCQDLENDDIKDDSVCARRIFRISKARTKNGFDAWAAWKSHCMGQNLNEYIKDCTFAL